MNPLRPGIRLPFLLAALAAALLGYVNVLIPAATDSVPTATKSKQPTAPRPAAAKQVTVAQVTPGQGMPAFDAIMSAGLKAHDIPGGALAIAKDGKLVVARGYGLANVKTKEPVTVDTLFSAASVSKTITAVAVLRLVDQGKLSLNDLVYPLLGRPRPLGKATLDPQVEKIAVRDLLLQAGGWDTKRHHDLLLQTRKIARATGEKLPLPVTLVVRYGLGQPLDFPPGTEIHFSNFGSFLARVIAERRARQPYETFVRQQVLQPMGVNGMRLEPLAPAYAAGESRRYGPNERELPGGRVPIAAPAGSWLASIVDLARFLTAVSGSRSTTVLSSAVRQQMLAVPPPPLGPRQSGSHPGLGWDSVREEPRGMQFYKGGSAAGVRTHIEHRADGVDWVLLLNSAGEAQGETPAATDLIDKIRQAIDATSEWPDRDLFQTPPAATGAARGPRFSRVVGLSFTGNCLAGSSPRALLHAHALGIRAVGADHLLVK